MASIVLPSGKLVLLDDEDMELIKRHKWHFHPTRSGSKDGYAATMVRPPWDKTKSRTLFMHTLVMHTALYGGLRFEPGYRTLFAGPRFDHVNTNKLDNQKLNLRPATGTQNAGNRNKVPGCSSRFKGVSWNKWNNRWQAQLMTTVNGKAKCLHLGYFDSEEDAAEAYRVAAVKYFGEYARF